MAIEEEQIGHFPVDLEASVQPESKPATLSECRVEISRDGLLPVLEQLTFISVDDEIETAQTFLEILDIPEILPCEVEGAIRKETCSSLSQLEEILKTVEGPLIALVDGNLGDGKYGPGGEAGKVCKLLRQHGHPFCRVSGDAQLIIADPGNSGLLGLEVIEKPADFRILAHWIAEMLRVVIKQGHRD